MQMGSIELGFIKELWVFLLMATVLALAIMITGKYFTRTKAFLLLLIYVAFLVFIGTQIHDDFFSFGKNIFSLLTNIANWIGDLIL